MFSDVNDIIVIDDFLPKHEFKNIVNTINKTEFPWSYSKYLLDTPTEGHKERHNREYTKALSELCNYYFVHVFFEDGFMRSRFSEEVSPLFKKINALTYLRGRAHMFTNNEKLLTYGMHVDYDYPMNVMKKITSGVYYLDNSDGKTMFEDGREVNSKENRLVVFPSYFWHSSTNCTNMATRRIINLDFITK
jgi:hypothetical protein